MSCCRVRPLAFGHAHAILVYASCPQEAMPVTKTSSQGRNLHGSEFVGGFGHLSFWAWPLGMSCNGFGGLGDACMQAGSRANEEPRSALCGSGGGLREGRKPWSFKRSSERTEAGSVAEQPGFHLKTQSPRRARGGLSEVPGPTSPQT